ncbi:MAG TPA: carboxypeptidase-like regulatory domain-containing protein, partial [Mucilaginibacter sp.]|nr:carboxypeptidase-like regulatory domain-containing protein [Mucilaginibacter sp.]
MITNLTKPFGLFSTPCFLLLLFFVLAARNSILAQSIVTGRIVNQADKKPVGNVNVFLSNATIGAQTAADGTFTLTGIKPGSYQLVVSIVGFYTYQQAIKLNNDNITLPDIGIIAKTIGLKEVVIKPRKDPDRDKYFEIFRNEFLGTSELAADCRIINPSVLDFDYDEASGELKASSYDFLVIENKALGYRIKYLLTDFSRNKTGEKVQFHGSVLFENMKGTASQQHQWLKMRQEVYEGSEMH